MDPKEKKVKEEEMNVEDILNNGAEDQPQNEQAEDAAPLTHEEELEQELEKAQETIEEQKDKYLRLSAEFDNYRKRTIKEKAELILNGGEKSLSSILPVVDDFERAIKTMETATDVNAVKEGVELIYNKFLAVLAQNGVKVINLGPGVDVDALKEAGGHLDAKITVDFAEQGQTVANDMISRLPDGGEVAVIAGLAGAGQSEGRTKGFKETVEANDKFNLVAVQNCDWDATLAYDATKALITEHPDLNGIFCCNDTMALAAVEALAAEGKEGVLVYGVDFTDDAREAIKAGTMTGSMSYSSARYTKAALQMAVMLNEGHTFDSYVYLPLTLVNVDNVNDLEGWK